MDYPHLVRTALTWPSGQLKEGVSTRMFYAWSRLAYRGDMRYLYGDSPPNPLAIFLMAIDAEVPHEFSFTGVGDATT